jgi:hypothetical protein
MNQKEIKTLNDLKYRFEKETDVNEMDWSQWDIYNQELKAEAVNEINNLDELEYILGLMSEPEKRILIKYIKWKNNLTEDDLKEHPEENHSPQESKVGSATEGSAEFKDKEPENKSSNESLQTSFMGSGSDIQDVKVFEDVIKLINNFFDKKQKQMEEHIKEFGNGKNRDIDIREKFVMKMLPIVYKKEIEKEIKEKWGKIE